MKSLLLGVMLTGLMTGCANQAELDAKKAEFFRNPATCFSDRECELKWATAQSWVMRNSRWKVRIMTNDYLETFGGPPSPDPYYVIAKQPRAGGGYTLAIYVKCNSILLPCTPNPVDAALDFNRTVNATPIN